MAQQDGKYVKDGTITKTKLALVAPTVTADPVTLGYFNTNALTGAESTIFWIGAVTTADGQAATSSTLASTPKPGTLRVTVGTPQQIGDGVKTTDCYFSADSGTTARALSAIVATDKLYWNGSIAGFQLATTDTIVVTYRS